MKYAFSSAELKSKLESLKLSKKHSGDSQKLWEAKIETDSTEKRKNNSDGDS